MPPIATLQHTTLFFSVLGVQCRASCLLGKCSTAGLHRQSILFATIALRNSYKLGPIEKQGNRDSYLQRLMGNSIPGLDPKFK
jgi:hypothetical protein